MKNLFRVCSLAGLLLVAACRMAPVYNVESALLDVSPGASMAEVTKAIQRAGLGLGWQMVPQGEGRMTGRLHLRSHVAVVDITYDTKTYSITYADSENLKYDGERIHSNYNSWVQNLSNAIRVQASAI